MDTINNTCNENIEKPSYITYLKLLGQICKRKWWIVISAIVTIPIGAGIGFFGALITAFKVDNGLPNQYDAQSSYIIVVLIIFFMCLFASLIGMIPILALNMMTSKEFDMKYCQKKTTRIYKLRTTLLVLVLGMVLFFILLRMGFVY